MNYKRIGRLLVCLLLVCCLIVRISPIQAKAATLTGTVAAGTAIAAGLVALGIGVGATEITFNNLVDSLTAVAGSDRVPVWISETADGFVTYLQESFLGSLLAHCFDTGVLVDNLPVSSTSLSCTVNNTDIFLTASSPFALYFFTGYLSSPNYFEGYKLSSLIAVFDGPSPYNFKVNGSSRDVILNFMSGYSASTVSSWSGGSSYPLVSGPVISVDFGDVYDPYGFESAISSYVPFSGSVTSSEDLTLSSVGATMSSPNYDPWRNAAIPVVPTVVGGGTADEDDALPVTFPGLDTPSITGQTQVGAQSGVTPGTVVEDILSGTGTGTGSGTGAEGLEGTLGETKTETFLDSLSASFSAWFAELKATGELIVEKIEALPAAFASWLEKILEWLAKIWEAIKAIPGLIAEAFADVLALAFVPAEGYLDAEVTSLCAQYPLADSCMNLITSFHDAFSGLGGEPPVIYIHLEDYEGSYNIGGTVPILDMRWYARYKPTVDTLLSSLLWIFFIWRVLVHAPSIISGVAGDVEAFNSGPSGGYFSADNPYRGQFERPARGRFESRRKRK